jgi:hypothetical protein
MFLDVTKKSPLRDSFYFAAGLGAFGLGSALGFAGARGFGVALGFAGALGTGAAIVASVPAGTTSTLVSTTGADSTLVSGAGASTLYGASGIEGLPNKNSLIFANIMFSYTIIY